MNSHHEKAKRGLIRGDLGRRLRFTGPVVSDEVNLALSRLLGAKHVLSCCAAPQASYLGELLASP